jgi:acyl-CoA synthetase (AMP-forming)/AMP-acid ligase II
MQTLTDLIERNERNYPENDVFVSDARSLTYRQYACRSRRLASALHGLGLQQQERVAILSNNNLEYLEIAGACAFGGFCAALFNFRLAGPEVEWLIKDAVPKVLFFEARFATLVDALRPGFPDLLHYVCIGGDCPSWAVSFEGLMDSGDALGAPLRARSTDILFLFFTSGTTGKPKGVPHDHRAVLWTCQYQGRACGPATTLLQITPLFHTGGMLFAIPSMWLAGKTVLHDGFDPLRFLDAVQRHRVTFTFMVAPMIEAVVHHPRLGDFDVSSLRDIMSASAAISTSLLKTAIATFGSVFFVAYGCTEVLPICLLHRHELQPDGSPEQIKRLGSVGHFEPEVDAIILDDDGKPCATGQVGEICVRSQVFTHYWNNSVATLEALRHGVFHTGDLGYQDDEGYVFLVDRKKDMIISGGENIYSREVEDAIQRHPAVREASVVGLPDPKWSETVKAFVVLHEGATVDMDQLSVFCQTQIARYKCPRNIEFIDALPRLGTGKVDKVTLRQRDRP